MSVGNKFRIFMFIQFSVENFRSFKDQATLSMIAGKRKSKDRTLDEGATFSICEDLRLLKCAVLYGANASGKSNLFDALSFMKKFVLNSSRESQADEAIETLPYRLSEGYDKKPSTFSIVFSLNEKIYQYSFSADQSKIYKESLVVQYNGHETTLFSRETSNIKISKNFTEGEKLTDRTRSNALFLSVCANFDGEISKSILRWFRTINVISGLQDIGLLEFTRNYMAGENSSKISTLLKGFDLGMERVALGAPMDVSKVLPNMPSELKKLLLGLQKISKGDAPKKIDSYHKLFDAYGNEIGEAAFNLDEDESEGSKKLVALSGPLVETLENSEIMFIDEFDARLHPIISKTIIKLFNSSEGNKKKSQLIVATHDTNLLDKDLLRRDQIWFVEKDRYGSSHLSSLTEYRVRNDASFEKDYIMGKYGAIPLLGDFKRLFDTQLINAEKPRRLVD
jgi:AAA15 family ATPase/GTPase